MKLYSINTGYFKLDGGAMFGVVPKAASPNPSKGGALVTSEKLLAMYKENFKLLCSKNLPLEGREA